MVRPIGGSALTKLAKKRIERGLSQNDLAGSIGISRPTLLKLELGDDLNPPLGYLVNAAKVLGCDLDDLLDEGHRSWHPLKNGPTGPPGYRFSHPR